ncbi:hypothetical protein ACJX0J_007915, partial [Zea mays]
SLVVHMMIDFARLLVAFLFVFITLRCIDVKEDSIQLRGAWQAQAQKGISKSHSLFKEDAEKRHHHGTPTDTKMMQGERFLMQHNIYSFIHQTVTQMAMEPIKLGGFF